MDALGSKQYLRKALNSKLRFGLLLTAGLVTVGAVGYISLRSSPAGALHAQFTSSIHGNMLPVGQQSMSVSPVNSTSGAGILPAGPPQADKSSRSSPTSSSAAQQTDSPPVCSLSPDSVRKDYEAAVSKAKTDLDNKLSFVVGMNISSQYVDTYNQKVADMYANYDARLDDAHCSFELSRPAPLPNTYHGS